jgi:hypothetical protein
MLEESSAPQGETGRHWQKSLCRFIRYPAASGRWERRRDDLLPREPEFSDKGDFMRRSRRRVDGEKENQLFIGIENAKTM